MDSDSGVALGVDMAPLGELPNTATFLVCASAVMVVLALFFIKHEIETQYEVNNRSNPARRVTVKL